MKGNQFVRWRIDRQPCVPVIPLSTHFLLCSLTAAASHRVKESRCIGLAWWDIALHPLLSVAQQL
jgi:hypothetical protein